MTAHVIKHEQCPECVKLGKDTSKDNLALYSDGGMHCFGCGYHVFPNKISIFQNKFKVELQPPSVFLPEDVETSYPTHALDWIYKYELTQNHLIKHRVLWSESRQLLIFPYYINNQLRAWQGRYFGTNKHHPKWISYGKIHEFLYFVGNPTHTCILVEDIVSAIKLSRYQQTVPIFGSHVSTTRLWALRKRCDTIVFWLDPDKRKESVEFAKTASLYFNSAITIFSDKDPKEHTYLEIEDILATKSIDTYFKTPP